jgi:hypothetical protein
MKRTIIFLLVTATYLLVPTDILTGTRKPEDKTIKELLGAADTISIGATKVVLETYLWRDFMPISPPDGKPMRAVVTLVPLNAETIPAEVDMVKMWVISNQTVWSSGLEIVGEPDLSVPQPKIEKKASGGPKWGPGITVTVLVQIRDPNGDYHLIKADDQMIHRTD